MTTLTAASARVIRSFSRQLPPLRPTRIAPRPDADFAEGIAIDPPGRHSPIDQRQLPTVEGWGLTPAEYDRINGAQNRARAAFANACPDATNSEVERVAWEARKDEFRRVLADRPAAPALKVAEKPAPVAASAKPVSVRFDAAKLAPAPAKRPSVRPRLESRPIHTPADESWWASHSPSNRLGFFVEGGADPYDTYANTMPATEYRELVEATCFGEPVDLSDDANGQFGYVREGGDR